MLTLWSSLYCSTFDFVCPFLILFSIIMSSSVVPPKRPAKNDKIVNCKQPRLVTGRRLEIEYTSDEDEYFETDLGFAPLVPLALDPLSFRIEIFTSQRSPGDSSIDVRLEKLKVAAGNIAGYGDDIVPFLPSADSTEEALVDSYGFGMEGLVEPFADSWDTNVKRLFGPALGLLGIPEIVPYDRYICSSTGSVKPQKVNLVFIAQPAVRVNDSFRPSKTNRIGERSNSATFWKHHLEKRQIEGNEKTMLDLGVRVLSCFLPEQKREAHDAAAANLDKSGHGIGGNFQYCTFWGETAESFVKLADSPVVRIGRSAGFQAVFALKDGLLQKTQKTKPEFGVRGFKFTSVDNFYTSKIVLLGFWKQCSADRDDYTLLSITNQSYPLGALIGGNCEHEALEVN